LALAFVLPIRVIVLLPHEEPQLRAKFELNTSQNEQLLSAFCHCPPAAKGRLLPVAEGSNRPKAASSPYPRMHRPLPDVPHGESDNNQR